MSEWIEKRKVKDVVLYEKGKAPANVADDDLVPYLTPEYLRGKAQPNFVPNQSNFVWVEDNEIILLWDGSNAGEFFQAKKGVLSSTMTRLIFNKEVNNTDYLFHYFKSIEFQLKAKTSGSGIPHVDKQILGNFTLRDTSPAEQARIARILSTVDAAITQTEDLVTKYGRVRTGLMQDLLTRGIDELTMKPLGQLSTIASGITLGKKHEGPDVVKRPYLRVANVQDGYLNLSEITQIRIPQSQIERYLLQDGDVLMNEGGDFDKLGRGTVWHNEIPDCLHQNHVFRVRCNKDVLLPDYLALVCASPYGKRFFVLNSKQSTNLASINSTQLKSFPIPLPEIDEQQRLVEIFRKKTAVLKSHQLQVAKLKTLKKALMQDLMSDKNP